MANKEEERKRKLLKKTCFMIIGWAALFGSAEASEVNWATLNPAFADATFVQDKQVCVECHEESVKAYRPTLCPTPINSPSAALRPSRTSRT